ncbi:MAG TPA: hypothetical protein VH309_08085 [Elusimicrobiota bacterium]|nr:hypothetical protein [Elusimicrobiota bacterium]
MRKRTMLAALLLAGLLPAAGRARADDRTDAGSAESAAPDVSSFFRRGRFELAAGGGYGIENNLSYLILGLGGGYYLRDGLSAGLSSEAWLGSQPQIYDVSPQLRYVFLGSAWRYKPYAGFFYRRTFYNRQYTPLDSVGARTGLVFPLSPRAYATGGLAFEHYFSCSTNINSSCDLLYPEVTVQFTF